MKMEDIIYTAPEMSTERLLTIIEPKIKKLKKSTISEIKRIHNDYSEDKLPLYLLEEFDLISQKKSNLSNSRRDEVFALVSACLIEMTKDDGSGTEESSSDN